MDALESLVAAAKKERKSVGAVLAGRPDRSGRAPGTGRDEPRGSDESASAPTDSLAEWEGVR